MKISVKVEYACRVLAEMARLQGTGELAQIEHLAKTETVPANFLARYLIPGRTPGKLGNSIGVNGHNGL